MLIEVKVSDLQGYVSAVVQNVFVEKKRWGIFFQNEKSYVDDQPDPFERYLDHVLSTDRAASFHAAQGPVGDEVDRYGQFKLPVVCLLLSYTHHRRTAGCRIDSNRFELYLSSTLELP